AAYLPTTEHNAMLAEGAKGFTMLGNAGADVSVIFGGLAASTVAIRDQKDVLQRAIRANVKAQRFIMDPSKRDKVIAHGVEWTGVTKEVATAVYNIAVKEQTWYKDTIPPDQVMKDTINFNRELMKMTAEFQPSQLFDLSFAQAAVKELDAKGWKP
ncbi:MAG: hypothetical protein Q8P59_08615, partial [Dehalococcoidia bacterium]|nr:hypothetical protein [Dehalococcoidia bacterium]